MSELTELRKIGDIGTNPKEFFKTALTGHWYFDNWVSKIVILACFLWSVYSLLNFAWGIL